MNRQEVPSGAVHGWLMGAPARLLYPGSPVRGRAALATPGRPTHAEASVRNLRLAFRTLRKTPFVTIVAGISLALGIGANAAIFSLFDQLLLRALPVPH